MFSRGLPARPVISAIRCSGMPSTAHSPASTHRTEDGMNIRNAALVAFILVAADAFAASRTFVSAGTGVDTNSCTRTAPCRSFTAALPLTDVDGEVIVLDSGGYGPVTITRGVSITSPGGVYAGITATTGNAITLSAPS